MLVYFSSRDKARNASFGKFFDAGSDAPKAQRYARKLSAISGNAKQRRVQIRRALACV